MKQIIHTIKSYPTLTFFICFGATISFGVAKLLTLVEAHLPTN